jgi:hypothetical protein
MDVNDVLDWLDAAYRETYALVSAELRARLPTWLARAADDHR